MGLLDLSLIRILPLDEDDFDVYPLFYPLYEEMRDLFSAERVLPVKDGNGYQALSFQTMAASNPDTKFAFGRKCSKYPRFRAESTPRTGINKELPLLKLYQQR